MQAGTCQLPSRGNAELDAARARGFRSLLLGAFDQAERAFDEAQRLGPTDVTSYAFAAGARLALEASREAVGARLRRAPTIAIRFGAHDNPAPATRRVALHVEARTPAQLAEEPAVRVEPPADAPLAPGGPSHTDVLEDGAARIVRFSPTETVVVELPGSMVRYELPREDLLGEERVIEAIIDGPVLVLGLLDQGSRAARLLGVDRASGIVRWTKDVPGPARGLLAGAGILYVAFPTPDGLGVLEAVDAETGTVLHRLSLDGAPGPMGPTERGIEIETSRSRIRVGIEGAMPPRPSRARFRHPTEPQHEIAGVGCPLVALAAAFDQRDVRAVASALRAVDEARAPRAFLLGVRDAAARLADPRGKLTLDLTAKPPIELMSARSAPPAGSCEPRRLRMAWDEEQAPELAPVVAASFGVSSTTAFASESFEQSRSPRIPEKFAGESFVAEGDHGESSTLLYGSAFVWVDPRGFQPFRVAPGTLGMKAPNVADAVQAGGLQFVAVYDDAAEYPTTSLAAFDAVTGDLRWGRTQPGTFFLASSSTILVALANSTKLIIHCPTDGAELARYEELHAPTDVVIDGNRLLVRYAERGQVFLIE